MFKPFGAAATEPLFPFTAVVTSKELNVRAGQSVNFDKIAELGEEEQVVVLDQSYGWYKIKLPAHAHSYISSKYVEDLGQGVGRVTGHRVNVRARPRLEASVLGQAGKDSLVRIVDPVDEEWFRIEPIEKSAGWIAKDYVEFYSADVVPARKVAKPTRNKYVLKRMAEEKKQAEAKKQQRDQAVGLVVSGVVKSYGAQAGAQDLRHVLAVDEQTSYLLKGYRSVFDIFLRSRVKIEGDVQKDIQAPFPVVFVRKIEYVL